MSCSPATIDKKAAEDPVKDSLIQPPSTYLSNCNKLFAEASKMDSILLSQTEVDKTSADKAIRAFTEFANNCPSDSMSPVYLIKTAQVARAINNIPQAKLVLDHCIDNYTTFKDRAAAIFLLAQLYDEATYLNNEGEARRLYKKILDEYPKSEWAASARGAMSLLGKTDEEILKEFKKKTK
jgi:hypothetical protein